MKIFILLLFAHAAFSQIDTIYTAISPVKDGKFTISYVTESNGKQTAVTEAFDLDRLNIEIDRIKEDSISIEQDIESLNQQFYWIQSEFRKAQMIKRELLRRRNLLLIRRHQLTK
jgi:hypothetical protein